MNILLIGANGMIGSRIAAEAASRGHEVQAASRNGPLKLDATDAAAVAAAAGGADVIVSSVSPRGGGDPTEEALAVAGAIVAAAERTGKRLIVIGGAGSLALPDGTLLVEKVPPTMREPHAMKAAFDRVKQSSADWTCISPSLSIAPGERTGIFRTAGPVLLTDEAGESKISAEDFAAGVVDELEAGAHRRQHITFGY